MERWWHEYFDDDVEVVEDDPMDSEHKALLTLAGIVAGTICFIAGSICFYNLNASHHIEDWRCSQCGRPYQTIAVPISAEKVESK